ncbi:hypothetical protein IFM89_006365 [Coptis chinensis]|uniref:Fungal lipase-type domain-containing protein n=1 Tax=Coptis chinensis TaxID=261450 RepID=A0A835LQI4_9MAGN|nr:hypothetical protein IFM89_006365 [Coptis chinensis]
MRPSGTPRAVLALRGTLLKSPTIRRDIEDDLRFLAWESLKSSVRFSTTLEALKLIVEKYGSTNVCIAGHSLGAGFALQVAMNLRSIGEKAGFAWKRFKSILPSSAGSRSNYEEKPAILACVENGFHIYMSITYVATIMNQQGILMSMPKQPMTLIRKTPIPLMVKLLQSFCDVQGKKKFLEAHGLVQWWSDDVELQLTLHNSKLISNQLKSLYTLPPPTPTQGKVQ